MIQNFLIPESVVRIFTTYIKPLRNKPYSRRIYTLSVQDLKTHHGNATDVGNLLVYNINSAI